HKQWYCSRDSTLDPKVEASGLTAPRFASVPVEIGLQIEGLIRILQDVSAAAIYITTKLSAEPQSPRSVCNVYAFLLSDPVRKSFPDLTANGTNDPKSYYLSEGDYHAVRGLLLQTETIVLRALAFEVKIVTPHHLAMTYLQTLGVFAPTPSSQSRAVAARTLGHLNTALFSPQLIYITHQPTALAVAAIYLASRETEVKLPSNEWWEVFDVDREDLGFLVVAMRSCEGWVRNEHDKWLDRRCPLDVSELEQELKG
ncbi:MAG: hypothetical protein Q9183_006979, partial [Haloplaca sp. 2 TL-2023]